VTIPIFRTFKLMTGMPEISRKIKVELTCARFSMGRVDLYHARKNTLERAI